MFSRVTIRVSDPAAAIDLYAAVLPALGARAPVNTSPAGDVVVEVRDLLIAPATSEAPVTRGLHIGLIAKSPAQVDAFWQAGVDAGFSSAGEPGLRPQYADDYYGGFLLDPDGNSIEAVHYDGLRTRGLVDHLWIRVQHAGMTRRFFETVAPQAGPGNGRPGFELVASNEQFARFRGPDGGSFTVVEGPDPTTGLDMAIGGARFLDLDGRSLKMRSQD